MTDYTEQWKNCQLEGFRWYYLKFKTGEIDICWLTEWSNDELGTGGQYFDGIKEENILEVLAPVPTFDEWKQLKIENKQLEKFCEEFNALNVSEENTKLKELLKEIRSKIKTVYDFDTREFTNCAEYDNDLLTKIDEALK